MEPVYSSVIGVARGLFAMQGLKFTILGDDNVPRTGGAVMTINHTGYFDFAYAGLAAQKSDRLVRFMAKDSRLHAPGQRPADARHEAHPGRPRRPARRRIAAAVDALRGRRDRRRLPGGDDLALLRAQGVQDRRGPDGRRGRACRSCPVVDLGLPAGLDQGPPQAPRAARTSRSSSPWASRSPVAPRLPTPRQVTEQYKAVWPTCSHVARAAYEPLTGPDLKFLPASLGGTAPTLAEATRLDEADTAERQRRADERRGFAAE